MKNRASILIVVMFVSVVITLATLSFAYRVALRSRAVGHRVLTLQLDNQAASASQVAMAMLAESNAPFDHPAQPWFVHPPLASQDFLLEWTVDASGQLPAFTADYYVLDEEGKLNVLYASSDSLKKLGMSEDMRTCLTDWMDSDDVPGPNGAENDFYLARKKPYQCKNAPLETLEELRLIRGFAPMEYLGVDAIDKMRLHPSEYAQTLNAPPLNPDGTRHLGWVDLLTTLGDGKINLNTAPVCVLETLPLSSDAVGQITAFREFTDATGGKLDDHAFRTEQDVDQLQGLTDSDKDVLKQAGAFQSKHFRIFVHAAHAATGLERHLELVVKREQGKVEVLQWNSGD
jgi:type II secretory pathway component PulK